MKTSDRIYVAGHRGLVGSAIVRRLRKDGFSAILTPGRPVLDLRDPVAVGKFFASERPAYVFLAAAHVGGIQAQNAYPADFLRDNLQIQTNVIDAAHRNGARKLMFFASSCIYPQAAPQPLSESSLLAGPLEPSNQWFAAAKLAGVKLCQAYRRQYGFKAISVIPANLYGPGANFDLESSHVLPALMRKCHEARVTEASDVVVWGTGNPRREFLHVDDLADAAVFLMRTYDEDQPVNVGCGEDISITELARKLSDLAGFEGSQRFDASKPDGAARKLLDVSLLKRLGWEPKIGLDAGLRQTYDWYVASLSRPQ